MKSKEKTMPGRSVTASKKEWRKLVKAVRELDKDAAKIMRTEAIHVDEFIYHNDIRDAFTWEWVKPGFPKWHTLFIQLCDKGYYIFNGNDIYVAHDEELSNVK